MAAQTQLVPVIQDSTCPGELEPARRMELLARIDAFVAKNIYRITYEELDYIISSFTVAKRYDDERHGYFKTRDLVLGVYRDL